jgi:hypothetical protein
MRMAMTIRVPGSLHRHCWSVHQKCFTDNEVRAVPAMGISSR